MTVKRSPRLEPAQRHRYRAPDQDDFLNPFNDREILRYYRQIYYWQGFIRFLGLPHLKDSPDVPIYRLFVTPQVSERPISADVPVVGQKERLGPLQAVKDHPRLVLLGDPGSGKSTLVNWIAWQLTRSRKRPWARALGPLLPLPMIVRELQIGEGVGWDKLLDAFLARPMAEDLHPDKACDYLERGQAFILLDGVDELSGPRTRAALREAVLEGVERYPGCRWLVTSRIVGYDRVPFHLDPRSAQGEDLDLETSFEVGQPFTSDAVIGPEDLRRLAKGGRRKPRRWADVLHIALFSDRQIQQFTRAWYSRYEEAPAEAEHKADNLYRAITSNHRTLALARIPNLLTLMALIHRIQARLPHGRALLYDKIADAYLESIDAYRGLSEVDYSLEEKKRWLAYVGFRMQQRRSENEAEREGEERKGVREILVTEEDVVAWLEEAMASSPRALDVAEPGHAARRFVDYIARRSGLLLPRGEGRYAFTHLSFQEFFAALYLEERITGPRWFEKNCTEARDGPDDLRGYADQESWREPLVLLFGLLAGRPEWSEELADLLFGNEFAQISEASPPDRAALARLLAEISVDPHSGLRGDLRTEAWTACWRWELTRQEAASLFDLKRIEPVVAQTLLDVEPIEQSRIWEAFKDVWSSLRSTQISLSQSSRLSDVIPLRGLERLKHLDLSGTSVADVSPLAGLERLEVLDLSGTSVADVSPLAELERLEILVLFGTSVTDLSPLASLKSVRHLNLSDTSVADVSPLASLESLRHLDLSSTSVADVSPLVGLERLEWLDLPDTAVVDVSPLARLERLLVLDLSGSLVSDVSPLAELEQLLYLVLSRTPVSDVSPLAGLEHLDIEGFSDRVVEPPA